MHVKISSAKWRPFCPGGDELTSAYFRNASLLIWSSSSPSASQGAWLMARNLSLHSFNRGSPFCKPILRRAWKYITMTSYERRDVSNQRQPGCSINRLFKLTTKLTEFHIAGLCDGIHWWLITYSIQQVTLNWLQLQGAIDYMFLNMIHHTDCKQHLRWDLHSRIWTQKQCRDDLPKGRPEQSLYLAAFPLDGVEFRYKEQSWHISKTAITVWLNWYEWWISSKFF